ncbi:MAG: hypothetical protein OXC29_22325, partial [Rhodococcus sp.]|nr:hypothetical protein [Rhodococcus sp. (in: high G+C Gram-positive bacteria)]
MTVLAVMIALVGAMFIALTPAQAANLGACGDSKTLRQGQTPADNCTVNFGGSTGVTISWISTSGDATIVTAAEASGTVTFTAVEPVEDEPSTTDVDESDANTGEVTFKISASSATTELGFRTVKLKVVDDDTTVTPVSVDNPTFKISFVGDADDRVTAGSRVVVKVMEEGDADLQSVSVQSLSFYAKRTVYMADDDDDEPDSMQTSRRFVGPSLLAGVTFGTEAAEAFTFAEIVTGACLDDSGDACTGAAKVGSPETQVAVLELFIPPGTTAGAYAVTASGTRSMDDKTPLHVSKTMNVGTQVEVETVNFDLSSPRRIAIPVHVAGQSEATLNPKDEDKTGGGPKGDKPDGYADDVSTKEPASISVGGGNNTELSLSLLNASGKPSEATSVSSIVISTTNGTLRSNSGDANYMCRSESAHACEIDFSSYKNAGDPLPGNIRVLLVAPGKPGTATVSAVVVAGGKVFAPDAVEVSFYGPAKSLEIGEASANALAHNTGDDEESDYDADKSPDKGADARDQITFSVDAADENGNAVRTPPLTVTIKGPDGKTITRSAYDNGQS